MVSRFIASIHALKLTALILLHGVKMLHRTRHGEEERRRSQNLCVQRRGEESKACTLEANRSTFFSTSAFSSRSEALGFFLTKSTTLRMHSFCEDMTKSQHHFISEIDESEDMHFQALLKPFGEINLRAYLGGQDCYSSFSKELILSKRQVRVIVP